MTTASHVTSQLRTALWHGIVLSLLTSLTACGGGGGDGGGAGPGPVPTPTLPAFTTQPSNQSVAVSATATFNVVATGTPTPTLQWQLSSNSGSTWSNIVGATASSYTTPVTVIGDSGKQYRVVATNSTGTANSNTATLTIVVASKAWGAAALIETVDTGHANIPQIAFDTNGNALAVWVQHDDATNTISKIWSNRYIASTGTWGTAAVIETTSAANVGSTPQPQIAIDVNGNALAVWHKSDGTRNNILANRYTASTGLWGAVVSLEGGTGSAEMPQIVIDANGNALAVWVQSDATRNVYSNRYTAGTGWGAAVLIETDNAGSASTPPKIAFDASGNALAVWSQSDGTRNNIWSNRYTIGVGWGAAAVIETDITGYDYAPQIAIDANGNALAVWSQLTSIGGYNIWTNRYTVGTGWGTAAILEPAAGSVFDPPQLAFDANGNALAVWYKNLKIWSNRYIVGTGWGTAEPIETDNSAGTSSPRPQIAFDANGNALAVWNKDDGTRDNIWANRYTAGTGWGTAALIETDNLGDASYPRIAIDANGNALAVWSQTDGTRYNIWSNRYQ